MYEEKISNAIALIVEHNEAIGQDELGNTNPGYIDPNEFTMCLKASGELLKKDSKGSLMRIF